MSRKSISKKLSRAIAIIVITSMTFHPAVVLAEETTVENSTVIEIDAESTEKNVTETPTSSVEQVDEANKEYGEQVNIADNRVADVADDVREVKDAQQAVDAASDYANESDTTKPSLADAEKIDQTYGELVDVEEKVDTDKKTVDDDVNTIDAKNADASAAVSDLDTATGDVDKLAKDVSDVVKTTDAALSEADSGIKDAKNDKEATDFYEKAKTALDETDKKLEQAATDYKEKEAAYQTALKNAEKAEAEYAKAVATASADVDAAIVNMNAAKEKAETLKGQAEEALKALQDAYDSEKIDLAGLEKVASDTALASEKANNDVIDKENECKGLKQAATQAADALETAKADKKTADDEEKTAQKEYDKASKSFDQEKYGLSEALSNMITSIDLAQEDQPALASDLIKAYVYDMVFDGKINARYSTLVFSEWLETDQLKVPYIKVSYSKKNNDQKEIRYFIYTIDKNDGSILINRLKESAGSTEDEPKFQQFYKIYSAESFKEDKDNIKSKSDTYLDDNKEKKDTFEAADTKLKTAKENAKQAETKLEAADSANSEAKEAVSKANGELEELVKIAEVAAENVEKAKNAYNELATLDGKFKIAVDAYTKLDAAAKKADKEVVDAANRLTALQEAINGLTKRILIADNMTEISAFTGRIAELKSSFEIAKKTYDDAVAQKKNLSEKIELIKNNLDIKLAKLAEEQAVVVPEESISRPASGIVNSATATSGAAISGETTTATETQSVVSETQTASAPVGQVLGARSENERFASNQALTSNTKSDISTSTEVETITETKPDINNNVKVDSSTDNKSEGDKTKEQGVDSAATIIDPVVPLAPVVPTGPENTTNSVPLILIILVVGAVGVIGFSAFEIIRRAKIR